ncbi:MAG: ADP-heptose synthase [Oligoflexia bacterium]|nr:ADP-heptose synthase [Oligoflexia bacterium]
MSIDKKIIENFEDLQLACKKLRSEGKSFSLCQGHFNVIHPGHLRFLESSKKEADVLFVALHDETLVDESVRERFYNSGERARGVASLACVDHVVIVSKKNFNKVVSYISPGIYVLGNEFKGSRCPRIQKSIDIVNRNNGKIIYSSGVIQYSNTEIFKKNVGRIRNERIDLFHKALKKQHVEVAELKNLLARFKNTRILVVGDLIVDQYCACDPLGVSSEAPVLVLKELKRRNFTGGAGIVARNISSLGAKCSYITITGKDLFGESAIKSLEKENVVVKAFLDVDRPTTLKIRYLVGVQKVLRVSRLEDKIISDELEEKIITEIDRVAEFVDGIVLSDFSYGLVTSNIIKKVKEVSEEFGIKIFADSQSSSQMGNILKFRDFFLLSPNEKEARLALADKYSGLELIGKKLLLKSNVNNVILKLGADGLIIFSLKDNDSFVATEHFPALNPYPVDVMGAGDALLSTMALSTCSGANIFEATAMASIIAAISVSKLGNVPVKIHEVEDWLNKI